MMFRGKGKLPAVRHVHAWYEYVGHDGKRAMGGLQPGKHNKLLSVREVVPIIFVPGFMGSLG